MNKVSYVILACNPDKGMKSYGSKCLMVFNNKKLLNYQIETIHNFNKNNNEYEIIVVSSFDTAKLQRVFANVKIIDSTEQNPIYAACLSAKYPNLLFIDYGCVFNKATLGSIIFDKPSILCSQNNKCNTLDVGCIVNKKDSSLINIFLDLPENKFCNMFFIKQQEANKIITINKYRTKNLLYFETINMLLNDQSSFMISYTSKNNFIFFNNMRQKNAINKFIK